MTIEVSIVISAISVAFAIFFGASALRRNNKADTAKDAIELTTVICKLEAIGSNIIEIKNDMRGLKQDIKDHGERLAKLEQQVKTLNGYHLTK